MRADVTEKEVEMKIKKGITNNKNRSSILQSMEERVPRWKTCQFILFSGTNKVPKEELRIATSKIKGSSKYDERKVFALLREAFQTRSNNFQLFKGTTSHFLTPISVDGLFSTRIVYVQIILFPIGGLHTYSQSIFLLTMDESSSVKSKSRHILLGIFTLYAVASVTLFLYLHFTWEELHYITKNDVTVKPSIRDRKEREINFRRRELKVPCVPTPKEILIKMMGPAFNVGNMAITKPATGSDIYGEHSLNGGKQQNDHKEAMIFKKAADEKTEFQKKRNDGWRFDSEFVDNLKSKTKVEPRLKRSETAATFNDEQNSDDDDFAVEYNSQSRKKFDEMMKRKNSSNDLSWECKSEEKWLYLGENNFPPFIRTVVCTQKRCFKDHFSCRPMATSLSVLRRLKFSCVVQSIHDMINTYINLSRNANAFIPNELREQWVLEEIAVTSCCVCGY
ncbi:hypothetical protein CHUAL_006901 [Chamberlinius hualienensis]